MNSEPKKKKRQPYERYDNAGGIQLRELRKYEDGGDEQPSVGTGDYRGPNRNLGEGCNHTLPKRACP